MPVDTEQFSQVVKAIEKKYGDDAIHLGSNDKSLERLSTRSLELDYITGGGLPRGKWSRFYGGFSSAKTLTCWNVVRSAQEQGLTCCYYNVEKSFNKDYVESLGIDLDNLHVIEGTTIEGLVTKLESLLGVSHVHIIDSCSHAVSQDELNSSMEDWHRGLNARVWGKALRRLENRFDRYENLGIFVDQVRINMQTGSENPPGGKMMEHASSMTLHFRKGKWLFKDKNGVLTDTRTDGHSLSGDIEADGMEIVVRNDKSKAGVPFKAARLHLDFATRNFDQMFEIAKAAVYWDIVKSSGSWYVMPDGTKLQGKHKLREALANDADLCDQVKKVALDNA